MLRTQRKNIIVASGVLLLSLAFAFYWQLGRTSLSAKKALGTLADFHVRDVDGNSFRLSALKDKQLLVLLFFGNSCPVNRAYVPRLNELYAKYRAHGVYFLGLNAFDSESLAETADFMYDFDLQFPVAKDWGAKVAMAAGATRTATVVVTDPQGRIFYRGRIDDQFEVGGQRSQPSTHELEQALAQLVDGQLPPVMETVASGCAIVPAPHTAAGPLTYREHVAPLLANRCVPCHRDGGIAPFALTNYALTSAWAPMIQEMVTERRMPPWHADPRYGVFANDRSLRENERRLILDWVAQGAPEGEGEEAARPMPVAADAWDIGQPDLLLTSEKHLVPAAGRSYFASYYFKGKFDKDTWIQAVQVKADAPQLVHHITVYVIPSGADKPIGWDEWGFLAAFASGSSVVRFPKSYGKMIPKGSIILAEVHFAPRGKAESNITRVAFQFAKKKPQSEVRTYGIRNRDFVLEPGARRVRVHAQHTFRNDIKLLALFPHAHFRGKAFKVVAEMPSGEKEILLNVPVFDFNWQNIYEFKRPVHLAKGTTVHCDAIYDNSSANPANPDPKARITWGPLSEEEMMFCWADYVVEGRAVSEGKGEGEDNAQAWKIVPHDGG